MQGKISLCTKVKYIYATIERIINYIHTFTTTEKKWTKHLEDVHRMSNVMEGKFLLEIDSLQKNQLSNNGSGDAYL